MEINKRTLKTLEDEERRRAQALQEAQLSYQIAKDALSKARRAANEILRMGEQLDE